MTKADRLLDAALNHAIFDGWSPATLAAARADAGMSEAQARAIFPRGVVDMALAYHRRGDRLMLDALKAQNLSALRFRERIAHAVRLRLELSDRELVRRGMSLFALPQHATLGSKALWQTAGHIWQALGDRSQDFAWYTKRASLSAVFSATALYWLGDESEGAAATWEFLDRRIENVMQFEKAKAQAKASPLMGKLLVGPGKLAGLVRAPGAVRRRS